MNWFIFVERCVLSPVSWGPHVFRIVLKILLSYTHGIRQRISIFFWYYIISTDLKKHTKNCQFGWKLRDNFEFSKEMYSIICQNILISDGGGDQLSSNRCILGFPTGRDSATFRDKGTEILSLSRDNGTSSKSCHGTGRDFDNLYSIL